MSNVKVASACPHCNKSWTDCVCGKPGKRPSGAGLSRSSFSYAPKKSAANLARARANEITSSRPKTGKPVSQLSRESRQRLRELNRRPGRSLGRNHTTDLYVVETETLVALMRSSELYQRMAKEQNTSGGGNDHKMVRQIGPTTWLATEVGVCVDVIARLLRCKSQYTGLLLADDIIVALGEISAFNDGRLPLYANPRIGKEKWIKRAEEAGLEYPALEWATHQIRTEVEEAA